MVLPFLLFCLWPGWGLGQESAQNSENEPETVQVQNPSQMPEAAIDQPDSAFSETQVQAINDTVLDLEPIDTWDTGVNPTGAVLMTPLFPGWGQLYTDNSWRAALAFGVEMFYWSNMLMRDRRAIRSKEFSLRFTEGSTERAFYDAQATENWEQVRDFAWWSGGVLLIIALDAYVGAHLFEFDKNPVPVPNDWEGNFSDFEDDVPGASSGLTIVVFQWGYQF